VSDEFFSFDEALDELRLKEEELKRLVSEGEIRAFRKGDTMKLRRSDVEALRTELSTGGEVVDLGESTEELVFEDDADDDAGMATQEIADVDTIIEEDIEDVGEIDLDDEPIAAAPVRRTGALAAAREEEEVESMGMRFAMILSAVVLALAVPVCLAVTTGNADDLAKSIAGIFGQSFEEPGS
jgi:excisionase family DNA binding protein